MHTFCPLSLEDLHTSLTIDFKPDLMKPPLINLLFSPVSFSSPTLIMVQSLGTDTLAPISGFHQIVRHIESPRILSSSESPGLTLLEDMLETLS